MLEETVLETPPPIHDLGLCFKCQVADIALLALVAVVCWCKSLCD